jgi:hypothetical protein
MTGEIIDADIILDDSMVKVYLREYEEMIRDLNARHLTDEMETYYRANPHRSPNRVIVRQLAAKHLAGKCGCHQPHQAQPTAEDGSTPPTHTAGAGEFMNRYRQCNLGTGMVHELALAGLYFAMLDEDKGDEDKGDEGKDKAKEDKKKDGKKTTAGKKDKDKKKTDKKKKKKEFPEEFIGQVIREIVCHEVGHTLGLRHNFKASTYRTLQEINSKEKPLDTTGSVMDYNPVNVAVDGPQGQWAPSALGPYDYWAIEYGYTPTRSTKALEKIASRGAEKGLAYGTDEDVGRGDPYINRFDSGADPIAYAKHRMKLVDKLRKDLINRTVAEGEGYQNLRRAFDMLLFETANAGFYAVQFVGGHELHRDHRGQPDARDPVVFVPAAKQREGLEFVCENILSDKNFTFPPELLRKLAQSRWMHWGTYPGRDLAYPLHERVLTIQTQVLSYFTYPGTLRRIYNAEHMIDKKEDCLTLVEMFDTLEASIWSELAGTPSGEPSERNPFISSTRRNLQRFYLEELIDIALDPQSSWIPGPVRTLARYHVKRLKETIDGFLDNHQAKLDTYTRSHLEECGTLLDKVLDADFQLGGKTGGGFFFF